MNNFEGMEIPKFIRSLGSRDISISLEHPLMPCVPYLNSNNLQGGLLDAFQNFTSLQLLYLSKNSNIEGEFPRTLGNLCYLRTLILSVNKLSGEITEFLDGLSACSYSTLENLDLGFNKLTGNLPDSLGHLKNLRYLQLWNYTSRRIKWVIPNSLGQLSSLVVQELNENSWEGVITEAQFANLSSLKQLSVTKNKQLRATYADLLVK
ncbi:Brassinosteroid LRR receptor kinase BRI1 [Vitis vinifera]|uniref:Brassinosteroid LRR receptor kinase BRI1 n=1 Tax=Vitis vinifera TaxID=29760 RepID=A0A438GHR6_VITVI|nr:Brassinosteroid LRR receptor kinase BRI1 [Vitis vinifera]